MQPFVFGKKKRKYNDWFDDNNEEIQILLNDKTLRNNKTILRNKIRALKNDWFQQKAAEAERYAQEKNQREFYAVLNTVYGPRTKRLHPVRSKNGELLTMPDAIKSRWVEHFNELLNQPTNVDFDILNDLEQQPLIMDLERRITSEELNASLRNTKLRKSPGPDGILPEILVYGGENLKSSLIAILNQFWMNEYLPPDLVDARKAIERR